MAKIMMLIRFVILCKLKNSMMGYNPCLILGSVNFKARFRFGTGHSREECGRPWETHGFLDGGENSSVLALRCAGSHGREIGFPLKLFDCEQSVGGCLIESKWDGPL